MAFEGGLAVQRKQRVKQAGVPDSDLGHLDLALAEVRVPGLQLAHDEGFGQLTQVAADGRVGDSEGTPELGAVPDLAVPVGQHRPEAAHRGPGNPASQSGEVALHEGVGELASPSFAVLVRRSEERTRKAAAEPEPFQGSDAGLGNGKARQEVLGDPTRQGLPGNLGGYHRDFLFPRCSANPERR